MRFLPVHGTERTIKILKSNQRIPFKRIGFLRWFSLQSSICVGKFLQLVCHYTQKNCNNNAVAMTVTRFIELVFNAIWRQILELIIPYIFVSLLVWNSLFIRKSLLTIRQFSVVGKGKMCFIAFRCWKNI